MMKQQNIYIWVALAIFLVVVATEETDQDAAQDTSEDPDTGQNPTNHTFKCLQCPKGDSLMCYENKWVH